MFRASETAASFAVLLFKELVMQQRFRRLAFFVGAAGLIGGGLVSVACGTDNGITATPQLEASTPKDSGGAQDDGNTTNPEGGPGTDSGTDADCTKNPVLHDYTTGFRCPFIDAGGPDAAPNCTNDQVCCETSDKVGTAFEPSYCATGKNGADTCRAAAAANGSTFNTGDAWECNDKNACAAGQLCCMIVSDTQLDAGKTLGIGNTLGTDKNHPPACGVKRAFNEGGSRCRAPVAGGCPTGEIKLCSTSDMNCATGTTCTPFVDFQQTHHGTCL